MSPLNNLLSSARRDFERSARAADHAEAKGRVLDHATARLIECKRFATFIRIRIVSAALTGAGEQEIAILELAESSNASALNKLVREVRRLSTLPRAIADTEQPSSFEPAWMKDVRVSRALLDHSDYVRAKQIRNDRVNRIKVAHFESEG